jgi:hypothetical protein
VNKLIYLILPYFLVNTAHASEGDAIGSAFIRSVFTISSDFTLSLYEILTLDLHPLYTNILIILLVVQFTKIMMGSGNVKGLINIFIAACIVNFLAFTSGAFQEWVYRPIMESVLSLASKVLVIGSDGIYEGAGSVEDSLDLAFGNVDMIFAKMFAFGEWMISAGGFSVSGLVNLIKGLIFYGAFILLYFYFITIFVFGLIAGHIILAAAPFAILMAVYPQTRGLTFNVIRAFSGYSLTPFFAAIIMGITAHLLAGIQTSGDQIMQLEQANNIPTSFFIQALLIAFFSKNLLSRATEFAQQSIGGLLSSSSAMTGGNIMASGMAGMSMMRNGIPGAMQAGKGIGVGAVATGVASGKALKWGGSKLTEYYNKTKR